MEELYRELYSLCGKLGQTSDPNKRWELELEIENVRDQIVEGAYTDD